MKHICKAELVLVKRDGSERVWPLMALCMHDPRLLSFIYSINGVCHFPYILVLRLFWRFYQTFQHDIKFFQFTSSNEPVGYCLARINIHFKYFYSLVSKVVLFLRVSSVFCFCRFIFFLTFRTLSGYIDIVSKYKCESVSSRMKGLPVWCEFTVTEYRVKIWQILWKLFIHSTSATVVWVYVDIYISSYCWHSVHNHCVLGICLTDSWRWEFVRFFVL